MILEALLNALYDNFLSGLPDIIISTNEILEQVNFAMPLIKGITYFLPMHTVQTILTISIMLFGLRMFLALLKALWASLPVL